MRRKDAGVAKAGTWDVSAGRRSVPLARPRVGRRPRTRHQASRLGCAASSRQPLVAHAPPAPRVVQQQALLAGLQRQCRYGL